MDTTKGQVDNTLEQRGEVYGSYKVGTEASGKILNALNEIHYDKHHTDLAGKDLVAIHYIVMKLVRLAATPEHLDSWHDIQGYAKLAEEMYNE